MFNIVNSKRRYWSYGTYGTLVGICELLDAWWPMDGSLIDVHGSYHMTGTATYVDVPNTGKRADNSTGLNTATLPPALLGKNWSIGGLFTRQADSAGQNFFNIRSPDVGMNERINFYCSPTGGVGGAMNVQTGPGTDVNLGDYQTTIGVRFQLVMTYDGAYVKLYCDGALFQSVAYTEFPDPGATFIQLGYQYGSNYTIDHDEVFTAHGALSAAQVAGLWNGGQPVPYAGLYCGVAAMCGAYFDGAGDTISTVHTANLDVSSGDWCWEGFVVPDVDGPNSYYLIDKSGVANVRRFSWLVGTYSNKLRFSVSDGTTQGGPYQDVVSTGADIARGVKSHIMVGRQGTTLYGFVNGVLHFATTQTVTMGDAGFQMTIGEEPVQNGFFSGKVLGSRLTKGVCRATATFTPPTDFDGFDPYAANVVSLLKFAEPHGAITFADQTGRVWTTQGSTHIECDNMPAAPLAWWKLDDAVTGTARDSSGNGFHGTYGGAYESAPRILGHSHGSVKFNDVSGSMYVPYNAALAIGDDGSWSAEATIVCENATAGSVLKSIITNWNNANTGYHNFSLYMRGTGNMVISGAYHDYNGAYAGVGDVAQAALNTAYHIMTTKSSQGMALYINGALVATNPALTNVTPPVAVPVFGNYSLAIGGVYFPGSYGFIGKLENIALYGRGLSATQVLAVYNSRIAATGENIWNPHVDAVSYFAITDGSGTDYSAPSFDDSSWSKGKAQFDSYLPANPVTLIPTSSLVRVWTRHKIILDSTANLVFHYGADDYISLWVNGVLLMNDVYGLGGTYTYAIPAGNLVIGSNDIAIKVRDVGLGRCYLFWWFTQT